MIEQQACCTKNIVFRCEILLRIFQLLHDVKLFPVLSSNYLIFYFTCIFKFLFQRHNSFFRKFMGVLRTSSQPLNVEKPTRPREDYLTKRRRSNTTTVSGSNR